MTAGHGATRIDNMLTPSQIRQRLSDSAVAVVRGDRVALAETTAWLTTLTARELVRIDDHARRNRYEGPALGEPQRWTREVLSSPRPVVAALAGMHPDGYVRERAVRSLITSPDAVSDRVLAIRVSDHVEVIRELAVREVLRRSTVEHAEHIVPLLRRIEQWGRGSEVLARYLRALVAECGEAAVWAHLRDSADHELRRVAFRRSFDSGLLVLADAVRLFPQERDQVVRRLLIGVIADGAAPEVVAAVLLHGRPAESRAQGLAKLTAAQLDPADVQRLLVDRSAIVRLWARRRWQEMGHDPSTVYATVARSGAEANVRARAYTGLAETGATIGHHEIVDLVRSVELPLRKAGLSLLRGRAVAEDVPSLLRSVADAHSRVARLASEVLAGSPQLWSLADLAPLKTAEAPELRRRAWWIHRDRGGWEAVIADLELLHDPDPRLAALGRQPVLPMYFQPTDTQKQRLTDLLSAGLTDRRLRLSIAFAAGLPDPELRRTVRSD
jgi:hypothetical protein